MANTQPPLTSVYAARLASEKYGKGAGAASLKARCRFQPHMPQKGRDSRRWRRSYPRVPSFLRSPERPLHVVVTDCLE